MYFEFFGLDEAPFGIAPYTDLFFTGAHRGNTLDALVYAVTQDEGIVKVTGEVGSGKTMLCRILPIRLTKTVDTVYLANPSLRRGEIIQSIGHELGLQLSGKRPHMLLRSLQEKLLDIRAEGRKVVVLIDEAHALPKEVLEEVRLLSNLETDHHKLLHIVLFGQPELNVRLNDPEMRQLRERITHNFALESLKEEEVLAYLNFRLRGAGYKGPEVFSQKTIPLIAQSSEGLARRINVLADKALMAAYTEGRKTVELRHVEAAITEAQFQVMHTPQPSFLKRPWVGFSLVALLLVGLMVFRSQQSENEPALEKPIEVAKVPETTTPKTTLPEVSTPPAAEPPQEPPKPTLTTAAEPEKKPENEPPAAPANTFEARLLATEAWLATAPDTHLFIQLLSIDGKSQADVEMFIAKIETFLQAEKIRVYRSHLSGKPRLGVIYGDYATPEEAMVDLKEVTKNQLLKNSYLRTVQKLR